MQQQEEDTSLPQIDGWTKEDEITILKGLINIKKSKRLDYVALYESVKQYLYFKSATQVHLKKKVKCLREKYKNNLKKSPHEEEWFKLSHKNWGRDDDHEMKQQFTSSIRPLDDEMKQQFTSCIRPLDPETWDKIFVQDLGLALTSVTRNQSNPMQVALQQYKLLSQSLSIRKSYANQILDARVIPKKEEVSEQKIARSYFDTKIQHAQLVSDAYNASHGFENSLINIATDCVLKEDTPKAMNEDNCPPATSGCLELITGKPSDTSPKSVSEIMCHSQERKKKKKKRKMENQCNKSQEERKKKRKMKKHNCESKSIKSMENELAVGSCKDMNKSATSSSQIYTLAEGLTVEVLVKGRADGKVASPGKQLKIHFIVKLRDTGCIVGSTIGAPPHKVCLDYEKLLKGLNIGIEGMHVGEKRRLTIPPSLGPGSKAKHPIRPDSWLLYEVELVDICE